MNEINLFENKELGLQARTVLNEDGSISVNAEDTAIGYGWYEKKQQKIYPRWRTINGYLQELGFSQDVAKDDYIPESLFYMLGFKAGNERALKFQQWLAKEVLPSIRKHGMYAVDQLLDDPDLAIKAFTALKEEREKRKALQAENEEMKPKALFADAVAASDTTILIGDLAKLLRQNGIETGQKRLFEWLRENGYLIKRKGSDWNMPTQRAMEMKLFEVKESTVNNPDGSVRINRTTKVTGKGQQYFINQFLGQAV